MNRMITLFCNHLPLSLSLSQNEDCRHSCIQLELCLGNWHHDSKIPRPCWLPLSSTRHVLCLQSLYFLCCLLFHTHFSHPSNCGCICNPSISQFKSPSLHKDLMQRRHLLAWFQLLLHSLQWVHYSARIGLDPLFSKSFVIMSLCTRILLESCYCKCIETKWQRVLET